MSRQNEIEFEETRRYGQLSPQSDGAMDTPEPDEALTIPAPAPSRSKGVPGSVTRATLSAGPRPSETAISSTRPDARGALMAAPAQGATPPQPVVISGAKKPRPPARYVVPRRSGPRSVVTQFIVSMVATAMAISVLALSTPLGQATPLHADGPFRALANVVVWAPTPTPTPKPQPAASFRPPAGANPGQQAIINEIVTVFGPNAQGALNVARCESGYDPNAWNSYPILGSHASGVFQILYPSTWSGTSYASQSPFNADANIHAAYQIFQRDGYSWREWQCKP